MSEENLKKGQHTRQVIISTSRKGLNMVNLVPTKETHNNVQAQHQDYPNNPI